MIAHREWKHHKLVVWILKQKLTGSLLFSEEQYMKASPLRDLSIHKGWRIISCQA